MRGTSIKITKSVSSNNNGSNLQRGTSSQQKKRTVGETKDKIFTSAYNSYNKSSLIKPNGAEKKLFYEQKKLEIGLANNNRWELERRDEFQNLILKDSSENIELELKKLLDFKNIQPEKSTSLGSFDILKKKIEKITDGNR